MPVVVTGDVHYLNPEDAIYRKILISSQGGANPMNRYSLPDMHFRTTQELLDDFAWMGEDLAKKLVIDNTHVVADMLDEVEAIKGGNYPPNMPTADDEIREKSYATVYRMYSNRCLKSLRRVLSRSYVQSFPMGSRLFTHCPRFGG